MKESDKEFSEVFYMIPDSFDTSAGVWPLRIGHNIAKPNYQSRQRKIQYYSVHLVKAGRVKFAYSDQTVILEEGDLFCQFPNRLYTYGIVPDERPLQMAWLAFDGTLAPRLLAKAGLVPESPYLCREPDEQLLSIAKQMQETAATRSPKRKLLLHGLIYRLFSQLLTDEDNEDIPGPTEEWVRKGLEFMHAHYMEHVSIQEMTRQIGINRSHFTRAFTKAVGMPPIHYLHKLRLDKSAQLLTNSLLSITEIALMSGYPDLYSYSRAFAKRYSVSPSRFRRDHPK